MRNRGCVQATIALLCCSFLLTFCPCSGLGPSRGLWAMKCCGLGPLDGLQGNLCTDTWSTSSPPSTLTSGSAGLFLTLFNLTPLCQEVFCSLLYMLSHRFEVALPYPESSAVPCGRVHWSGLDISSCEQYKQLHTSTAGYRFGPMARTSTRWDHGMSADCAGSLCWMEISLESEETRFLHWIHKTCW